MTPRRPEPAPIYLLVVAITFFLGRGIAYAQDKALLIGTGSYQDSAYNLAGIDLDLATMRHVAMKIGIEENNIRVLADSQVTKRNIKSIFSNFLTHGTNSKDRLLIYYSGHGVQLEDDGQDEEDGRDEALTLYNLQQSAAGYSGVLRDDEFATLLQELPSENVLVVIDACHSGTVTRSMTTAVPLLTKAYGDSVFQVKALPYRSPEKSRTLQSTHSDNTQDSIEKSQSNLGIVTLSAAQDNEKALATQRGSMFTLALAETLDTLDKQASARRLVKGAEKLISQRVDPRYSFHPNLSGDPSKYNDTLVAPDASEQAFATNWSAATNMAAQSNTLAVDFSVTLSQKDYEDHESIKLTINSLDPGYLNILGIDENDNLILLYPNRFSQNNKIKAGQSHIPGDLNFEWIALEPWGDNLLLAIFSSERINLFDSSLQRDRSGNASFDYVTPSMDSLQLIGFGDYQGKLKIAASTVQFRTCKSKTKCK